MSASRVITPSIAEITGLAITAANTCRGGQRGTTNKLLAFCNQFVEITPCGPRVGVKSLYLTIDMQEPS